MKVGVLLVNLGTPNDAAKKSVRKYLTQFLNDSRVIDIPALSRFFLVNFFIIPFRSAKSSKLYQQIWDKKTGSPLLHHSHQLQEKLQQRLGTEFCVELAMRYQKPSIKKALENLRKKAPKKIIVLPLYPHYASSSTGSTLEAFFNEIKNWEVIPELHLFSNFFDNEDMVDCFVENAKKFDVNTYDHVLFSYHGLPERQIHKASAHYGGNTCHFDACCEHITEKNQYCYRANCFKTTQLIAKKMQLPKEKYTICFQSRLGRSEWVKPYTDVVLKERAAKGDKKILAFSPAFVADCLETVYEISHEYNDAFKSYGGEQVQLVPSLNSSDSWVQALEKMIKKEN
ncbi:MAG: ferrochelatase [Bacteroidetes bacterium]|nr:ferrochelatase [Bacteroidota bacterium]